MPGWAGRLVFVLISKNQERMCEALRCWNKYSPYWRACTRSAASEGIKHGAVSGYSGFGSALTLISRHTSSWKTSGDQARSYCLQLLFTSLCFLTCYHPLRSSSKTVNIIISLTISVKKLTHGVQVVVWFGLLFVSLFWTCPKGPDPMWSCAGRPEGDEPSSRGGGRGSRQGLPATQTGLSAPP